MTRSESDRLAIVCLSLLGLYVAFAYVPRVLFPWTTRGVEGFELVLFNRDFANYWLGAKMTLMGEHLALFDQAAFHGRLMELFGPDYPARNWGYPPHFLLLVWPLGLLDYVPALVTFLAITGGLFVVSVRTFRARFAPESNLTVLALALVPAFLVLLDSTQNGFLTSALLLFALSCMAERPVLAGLSLALLTVKPQLGVFIPLVLLMDRNWRVIGWTIVFATLMVGVSAFAFGWASWRAYLDMIFGDQTIVLFQWAGPFLYMMPTVFAGLRTLGVDAATAMQVQIPWTLLGIGVTAWMLWKTKNPLARWFLLMAGTFLSAAYAFNYDMAALCAAAALLAGSGGFTNRLQVILVCLVAAWPGLIMNLGRIGLPVSPLILALAMIVVFLWARDRVSRVSVEHANHGTNR